MGGPHATVGEWPPFSATAEKLEQQRRPGTTKNNKLLKKLHMMKNTYLISSFPYTHTHTEVLFVALIDISKLPSIKSYTLSECSHHERMECLFPHSFINNTSLTFCIFVNLMGEK